MSYELQHLAFELASEANFDEENGPQIEVDRSDEDDNGMSPLAQRRQAAQQVCGGVQWFEAAKGTYTCPSGHEGTVFIDDPPNFFCFHERCESERRDWNEELRHLCAEIPGDFKPSEEDLKQRAFAKMLRVITNRTRMIFLPELLRKPPYDPRLLVNESPTVIPENIEDHAGLFVQSIFKPDNPVLRGERQIIADDPEWISKSDHNSKVWIGELHHTGQQEHAKRNFRTRDQWVKRLQTRPPPGGHICPAMFSGYDRDHGFLTRSTRWTLPREYWVCESDKLPKEQFANIIQWLCHHGGLTLRAVVFSGNKSIHAWYDRPAFPHVALSTPERYELPEEREIIWFGKVGDTSNCSVHWNRPDDPRTPAEHKADRERWRREWDVYEETKKQLAPMVARWRRNLLTTEAILAGLGCDKLMFRRTSTARLPGVERFDDWGRSMGWQQLWYLDPKYHA